MLWATKTLLKQKSHMELGGGFAERFLKPSVWEISLLGENTAACNDI